MSVDAFQRTPGRTWFSQEALTDWQADSIVAGGRADVVVSHNAPFGVPTFVEPFAGHPSSWPDSLLAASDQHQRRIGWVVDRVQAGTVFCGHHHVPHRDLVQGSLGPVRVNGLDRDRDRMSSLRPLVDGSGPLSAALVTPPVPAALFAAVA